MKRYQSFILLLVLCTSVNAGIKRVPQDFETIKKAIEAAEPGDTVLISTGNYPELFIIDKSISLVGVNPDSVLIYGFDTQTTSIPTIQINNISKVYLSSITVKGRSYSVWFEGFSALSINNSTDISLNGIKLFGGNGADACCHCGWSYSGPPHNGGNAFEVNNSRNVIAANSSFYKGDAGKIPWSPYNCNYSKANDGISIVAKENSQVSVYGYSYVSMPVMADETSSIKLDIQTNAADTEDLPDITILEQNYPNPFNPSTMINYSIPKQSFIVIRIYDALGNEIKTLVRGEKAAGNYSAEFNAENLSSGMYFYQIQTEDFQQTRKMLLIR